MLDAASEYFLHLLSCALRSKPAGLLPESVSWDDIYAMAGKSSVEGAAWAAVRAHATDMPRDLAARWEAAAQTTLWRRLQFDAEREQVRAELARLGIATLPLKGASLADLYPDPSMRSMTDNDILFGHVEPAGAGATHQDGPGAWQLRHAGHRIRRGMALRAASLEVKRVMEARGFEASALFVWNNDIYKRPPIFNFEMHRNVCPPNSPLTAYYADPWRLAVPDERQPGAGGAAATTAKKPLNFHLAPSDEYLYVVAHAWHHFASAGCGIRHALDVMVLLRNHGSELDWDYIARELDRMGHGVAAFETRMRATALTAFGTPAERERLMPADAPAPEDTEAFLAFLLAAGVFGSRAIRLARTSGVLPAEGYEPDAAEGRLRYMWHRLVMDSNGRAFARPVMGSSRLLLPVYVAVRLGEAVVHAPKVARELVALARRR